ncbi:MAG TPA: FAD-dependent monooxygenase [Rhizomicrobium sp.]|nr:FAD-dependent monooxygenase [Rhizomicrobium sp.]
MRDCDVLIVGAGPTGLVLALWLTKFGVKCRIVDKTDKPGSTSRALAVHARTLELYRQLDLTEAVIQNGHKVPAVNLWVKGEKKVHLDFATVGEDLTPYPFLHIFPQDEHERLLVARLEQLGVAVERSTSLLSYAEEKDGIMARLATDKGEQQCHAAYIAGCDGARSRVRETMGTGFPGGTYAQIFYVADVEASGPAADGELHVDLDEADFVAVFPLKGQGRARLIGTVRDERARHPEALKFEDVADRAIGHMKVDVKNVHWFSTYRVHHRVTQHFRKNRAFVLGDAAHIHSPVGGQGMNTGIGDAINLAWKLSWVVNGRAPDALLDSYEPERIAFARRLVATTDRVFSFVSTEGPFADLMRTRVAPLVIPAIGKVEAVREWLFRTVSQTLIHYRGSALAQGRAGSVEGGDRLPWAFAAGLDNYAPLAEAKWQGHVYGDAEAALRAWFTTNEVPLHVFSWCEEYGRAGLRRNALYLLRPDTYVALAAEKPAPEMLTRYFAERQIQP